MICRVWSYCVCVHVVNDHEPVSSATNAHHLWYSHEEIVFVAFPSSFARRTALITLKIHYKTTLHFCLACIMLGNVSNSTVRRNIHCLLGTHLYPILMADFWLQSQPFDISRAAPLGRFTNVSRFSYMHSHIVPISEAL